MTDKASTSLRVLAKMIDLGLVFLLGFLGAFFGVSAVGSVLGVLYLLFSDGLKIRLLSGQSLGKKLFSIRVIRHGRAPGLWYSVLRNFNIAIVAFLMTIPLWGWLLAVVVAIPVFGIEIFLMIRQRQGMRLGDAMADTWVIPLAPISVEKVHS